MKNILLLGGLAFAGYLYMKNKNQNPFTSLLVDNSVFPLKQGDNNIFVKNVQKALINKGGEIAQLVLSSGGANGLFNEQTQKALELCGYPNNLSETHYKSLVNTNNQLRNIAYVIDVDGADLFSEINDSYIPQYGYGRNLLIHLPAKTYLGKTTGNYKNGMIEITTQINTLQKRFWVATSKVALVNDQEYNQLKQTSIIPKSDDAKMKLF